MNGVPRYRVEMVGRHPFKSARTGLTGVDDPVATTPYTPGIAARMGRHPTSDPYDPDLPYLPPNFDAPALVFLMAPLGIPLPYPTDDQGNAYPAGSWLLIEGDAGIFAAASRNWVGWNPSFVLPLTGGGTGAGWLGPADIEVFNLPAGSVVTVTWEDNTTGAVFATATITGTAAGGIQTASFDKASASGFTHSQVLKVALAGAAPACMRGIDWHLYYAQFPIVFGSLPGGYVARQEDDRVQGWETALPSNFGGPGTSLINLRYVYSSLARSHSREGWPMYPFPNNPPAVTPDADLAGLWQGPGTMNYYFKFNRPAFGTNLPPASATSVPWFSWEDSAGGMHVGGVDPAFVRPPTVVGTEPENVILAAGVLSYVAATGPLALKCVQFRPTSGPALYDALVSGSGQINGWGEYPFATDTGEPRLSHGDGRPFWAWVFGLDTLTLIPVPVTPTLIPPGVGGLVTTGGYYLFGYFVAPADGTYQVSASGISAEVCLSTTGPLATDGVPVQFDHDHIADAAGPGDAPPATPDPQGLYIVGKTPTGAWAGQPNQLALWNAQLVVSSISLNVGPWGNDWQFRSALPGQRYGDYLWTGSTWVDVSTLAVRATVAASAGQTIYVRASGQQTERTRNLLPAGVTLSWKQL